MTDEEVEETCESACAGTGAGYRLELCPNEFRVKVRSEGGSWDQKWFERSDSVQHVTDTVREMAISCARYDKTRGS